MCETGASRGGETEEAEGEFGEGEVEALLPWLPLAGRSQTERGIRVMEENM